MCSQSGDFDFSADTQLAGQMVCAAEGSTTKEAGAWQTSHEWIYFMSLACWHSLVSWWFKVGSS